MSAKVLEFPETNGYAEHARAVQYEQTLKGQLFPELFNFLAQADMMFKTQKEFDAYTEVRNKMSTFIQAMEENSSRFQQDEDFEE
jgi:hypothetical protein